MVLWWVPIPSFASLTTNSWNSNAVTYKNNFQDLFVYFKETPEVLTYFLFSRKNTDYHITFLFHVASQFITLSSFW